jgi:hypothetical protein
LRIAGSRSASSMIPVVWFNISLLWGPHDFPPLPEFDPRLNAISVETEHRCPRVTPSGRNSDDAITLSQINQKISRMPLYWEVAAPIQEEHSLNTLIDIPTDRRL